VQHTAGRHRRHGETWLDKDATNKNNEDEQNSVASHGSHHTTDATFLSS
jgi:hypothetical protein